MIIEGGVFSLKMSLSSRAFAKQTGYPLKTIRDLCKSGKLPHNRMNNGYYILVAQGLKILEEMAVANMNTERVIARAKKVTQCSQPKQSNDFIFDRSISFQDKIAELKRRNKEACKARKQG